MSVTSLGLALNLTVTGGPLLDTPWSSIGLNCFKLKSSIIKLLTVASIHIQTFCHKDIEIVFTGQGAECLDLEYL